MANVKDQIQPIAIVGLNLKFPGDATSVESFWEILEKARNASSKVPSSRFNVDAFYHPDPSRLDSKAHFMKEDPRAFDAAFFNMSPAEASILDPQQRGLLEGTYHTFENAGLAIERVAGSQTSVFCASFGRDSDAIVARDPEFQSRYQATSSGSSMLSNRISHFFDLRGPSLTIDTACSSGLYAIHLACQSILNGESEMSLVCGSNTYLTPECMSFPLSNAGFLSPDGRSYSFDRKANGYARGEGYAFVLLKPLAKALEDGDTIRSVIRATGANQDGRTPSITQPSAAAQVELIRRTYEAGGLDLSETEYVEAHGTGTPVGDPIEVSAIGEVFRSHRSSPLWIGSVKSNIGHLEGASGLAGLLKTVLSLEKAIIPPIADFEAVNPAIDVHALGVQFPTCPTPWPVTTSGIRRASVSSFGYGGSNAHAVLDDAYNYLRIRGLAGNHLSVAKQNPSNTGLVTNSSTASGTVDNSLIDGNTPDAFSDVSDDSGVIVGYEGETEYGSFSLLTFSAADEDGPRRQVSALQDYVAAQPQKSRKAAEKVFLADLAYTLSQKSLFNWRAFAVVNSEADVRGGLTDILSPVTSVLSSKRPELNFVFTGQGAQYPRMGVNLIRHEVFRQSLLDCDEYLRSLGCEWSVLTELRKASGSSRVQRPEISQPLCTALQIAIVDLLRTWNIVPQSVCGHSSGEIAAAYCAGALDRRSGWKIAYFRGVLASRLVSNCSQSQTTMMSVGLGEVAVRPYLSNGISVACINSPVNVTLSGPIKGIQLLQERLEKEEVFFKRIPVNIGYHSPAMEAVAAEYRGRIRDIGPPITTADYWVHKESPVTLYSSTEGDLTSFEAVTDPAYWVKNLISPVLFSTALEAMTGSKQGRQHFLLEIGPQSALRRPVQDTLTPHLGDKAAKRWQYTSILNPDLDDGRSVMEALGTLWAAGIPISLTKPNQNSTQVNRRPKILVDLPLYPFNRSREFWEESRLSRNYAKRLYRRHALLGIRDRDWNAEEGSWRHLIRSQENPWILDHALNGSPLYPGSGMLVMAIEAARQLAAPVEPRIRGYQLENIRFLRAIDVDDSERGTEAKIVMRRRRQATNTSGQQLCYDWRVFGTNGDDWSECAYGSIKVELEPEQMLEPEQVAASEARRARFALSITKQLQADVDKCRLVVHHSQLYKNMSKRSGFDYGPYFQLLRDISYDREGHATATLASRDYASTMAYAGEDPCVVHPSTLDAVCHLQMVALSQGGWNAVPTMMFSHLRKLWVSQKLFEAPGNPQLRAATQETMRAFREAECRTLVTFANTNEPVLVLEGQRGTAITSLKSADATTSQGDSGQKFYGLDYKPDLSLLTEEEKTRYFASAFQEDPRSRAPPKELIDRADAIALHFIEAALEQIDKEDKPIQFDNHLNRYVAWMRRVHQARNKWTLESRGLSHLNIQEILLEADGEPTQKLTKKVGESLHDILKGEANALQVIFEGNLANEFYHSEVFATNNSKMGAYMSVLAHANPKLRVLEVGAGTGSSTGRILPYLTTQGVEGGPPEAVRFGEYCYTDISAGFFEKARDRFSYAASHMTFKKLDLEKHPETQGFADGTYDVIVAGNVLHATSDLLQTLRYVRGLLRPGGVLVLGETVNLDNVRDGLIFGLLPGWWLREGQWWSTNKEYQDQGPLLTEEQWNMVLCEAGFPGIQMAFRDHEQKPHHRVSVIITTRPENESIPGQSVRLQSTYRIVVDPASTIQTSAAESLRSRLIKEAQPTRAEISSMASMASGNTKLTGDEIAISLLELDGPVLPTVAANDFATIKKICLDTRFTLWLTYGGAPKATNPAAEIAVGLGRSVCSERGDQGFITLSLSSRPENHNAITSAVDTIMRVVRRLRNISCPGIENESEFSESNGLICIPRLMPTPHIEQALSAKQAGDRLKSFTFNGNTPKPHISITIETPGLLDTIFYAEDSGGDEELQAGDIEIEVEATSMNFKDVMIALGQIPGRSFGFDGAGVVSRVAPGSQLRPGDAVLFCSSNGGGFGTYVRCPELQTEKIPLGMSFQVAAAIPAVWSTVVYSLDHIARLSEGETVLIHAAAGGVGQAAVQLAQLRGAKIFVTVGSQTKRELVKQLFGISDDQIFNSRDDTFAEDVLHATGGRGLDVVLNSLGGELLRQSWECIAPFGRFIDIGKADIIANNTLPMGPFNRNVTFSAVDLVVVHEEAKPLMKKILQDVTRLFEQNPHLHEPKPLHIFSPSKLEDAMRFLQGGKNTGKVIIDYASSSDTVEYRPSQRQHRYDFQADATYVISGGLGGLGREIARWMVSRGARNLLLLSSRGVAGRPDALKFIRELETIAGVTVLAPACDIVDRGAVEETLLRASRELPPIKGCIQAAMVLRDDMLAKMSCAMFHETLNPKRAGSWNLHQLLPNNMDFFVLLSSFCGIMGNRGQSNYAAGNTFEDALARHRVAQGLKGVSVDLMLVADAGWANVNYESVTQSLRAGNSNLTQAQLMELLDMLCDPSYDCAKPGAAQVVNMVDSAADLARMTQQGLLDWMHKPMFSNFLRMGETEDSGNSHGSGGGKCDGNDDVNCLALVKAAADLPTASEIVTQGLVQKLAKSLSVPIETLDAGKPAYVVGVDSLIAVEVRYWFMKQLLVEVPVFEILKNQSITDLCQQVASKILQSNSK
ncbi:KR domain-containing protein [Colletotrichum orchidophilum]|uniref:KR domain-containing protein n=1 Tax=Colletotrichum orchidophilum TaxID=1209926 RepID=A0A1G4BR95_9PEZI|nr:KR domain-containing protein [Colletotrichum orchidophilum]OHF03816.1 KR domain-containing protein [Colletotrichum orchidophilum]